MKREILINGSQRETRLAILEDDRLVELLVDRPDHRRTVGDIYLGRVDAVLPGIQAAFVDIGQEKSAFLHASDLLEPDEDDEEPSDEDTDEHRGASTRQQVRGGGEAEAECQRGRPESLAGRGESGATATVGAMANRASARCPAAGSSRTSPRS